MVKYATNRKLLSRAKWRGSLYFRQRSGTWRKYGGKDDGQIYRGDSKRPSDKIAGEFEMTYDNFYSRDKTRPRKAVKK